MFYLVIYSLGSGEFRRIVLPESDLNSEEEVLIATNQSLVVSGSNSSNKQTADKILALISEIGSSQILQQGINKEEIAQTEI